MDVLAKSKNCSSCKASLPFNAFRADNRTPTGLRARCNKCETKARGRSKRARNDKIREGGIVSPPWATNEGISLESRIRRWHLTALMRQRHITHQDIADILGVSQQRVAEMVTTGKLANYEKIEDVITYVTVAKHSDLGHRDTDLYCIVYCASGMDPKVAHAKALGERGGTLKGNQL